MPYSSILMHPAKDWIIALASWLDDLCPGQYPRRGFPPGIPRTVNGPRSEHMRLLEAEPRDSSRHRISESRETGWARANTGMTNTRVG
jgi:hypothetical protein